MRATRRRALDADDSGLRADPLRVALDVAIRTQCGDVERPDPAVLSPSQGFFLRENLKLRLLNARLALMARQFDAAQADLKWAQGAIERYFNRGARRTQVAAEMLRQVAQQAKGTGVARPDETFAALATAGAAR